MSARIDPLARVDPSAVLADGVEVGPFAFVGPKASLGPGTVVMHHGSVHGWTRMGAGNRVWPYACVGGDPEQGFERAHVLVVAGPDDGAL